MHNKSKMQGHSATTRANWTNSNGNCGHRMLSHAVTKSSFCVYVTLDYCSWCFLGINSDNYWFPLITQGVQFRPFCWRILPIVTLYHWDLPKCLEDESLGWMNHHTSRVGWVRFWKISSAHTPTVQVLCIYPYFFFKYRSESMTSRWFRLVIDCPHKNLGVNVSATCEHCLIWWLWSKKGQFLK